MVNSGGPPSAAGDADAADRPAAPDGDATRPAAAAAAAAAVCCSVPLDKVQAVLGAAARKLLCLYCDRSFASPSLRQKHVERGHGARRGGGGRRRRQPACPHCAAFDGGRPRTPAELFGHLVAGHPASYFGCVPCEERFPSAAQLAEHNAAAHARPAAAYPTVLLPKIEEVVVDALPDEANNSKVTRSKLRTRAEDPLSIDAAPVPPDKHAKKKLSVKSSKLTLKRSKRLEAQARDRESQKKIKKRSKPPERKNAASAVAAKSETSKTTDKTKSCINPYPEFDNFYRVKKITDHSIDNLKISSLTFDDVFDKAFFNRIKCNIEENLTQHIDGKLFKNEESESRISNFEKVSSNPQEIPNSNPENYGCEVSLNAVAPITSISLNTQMGEDFESQIEYGAKASKKKTQIKKDEIHYKYFTRRKYQASILEHKENRDLSRLDMWTQLVIKERQQKMLDDKKSAKEMLEYTSCEEYKNKIKREELNRILDRRGPFEDLKEEATKKAAFEKLNASPEASVNEETFLEVRAVLNGLLNKVCELFESREASPEPLPVRNSEERQIPAFLNLRRTSSLPSDGEMDRSDRITLICSSQETENFELPTNGTRAKNELVELTGEWARCRMYVCAACGAKLPNMRYLLEHKGLYHQNVWAQHYEFVGNQSELYRHLSIPGLGKVGAVEAAAPCKAWRRSEARACTKCAKQCNSLGELHRHVLECGGDWTWMLARKKCKYRPFGAKSRRKRRGLVNRVHHKQKAVNSEKKTFKKPFEGPRQRPSDADTIQRMLANLPAKRRRRTIISLQDAIYKSRKNKTGTQSNRATNQSTENTNNGRKAVRSLNKVLSSRILDTNSTLMMKRKLKSMRSKNNTQPENVSGEEKEEKIMDILKIPQIHIRPFNLKNRSTKNADVNEETEEPKKKSSPRNNTNVVKNKVSVKKILSSKLNIKNFFPVKKKKNKDISTSADEANSIERPTRSKVTGKYSDVTNENANSKKSGLKSLVRSLSNRRRKVTKTEPAQIPNITETDNEHKTVAETSVADNKKKTKTLVKNKVKNIITNNNKQGKGTDKNSELSKLSKKRKLQNSFRTVIDKVKKLKIDNSQYNKPVESISNGSVKHDLKSQTNIFLEKEKQEKESLMTGKIVSPLRIGSTLDKSLLAHTANNFSDTKENPPIPETIFNLETCIEKSLQAKGELDFDKRQDDVIPSKLDKQLLPITIETSTDKPKTSPMVSPNPKGKIRKPNRGLNDCIAMLTNKLQQKDQNFSRPTEDTTPISPLFTPSGSKALQKTDYILRVPTFRVTTQPQSEEIALDLSKKTSSMPEITKALSNPDLSVNNQTAFPFINNVVNSAINTMIGNVIENKCKEVLNEKLCPTWGSVDSLSHNIGNNACIRKCNSLDETIEFVVNNYHSVNSLSNNFVQLPVKKTAKKASGSSKKAPVRKLSTGSEISLDLPESFNNFGEPEENIFRFVDSSKKKSVTSKKSSGKKLSIENIEKLNKFSLSLPESLNALETLEKNICSPSESAKKPCGPLKKNSRKKLPTDAIEPELNMPRKPSRKKPLEVEEPGLNLLESLNLFAHTEGDISKNVSNARRTSRSSSKKSAKENISTEDNITESESTLNFQEGVNPVAESEETPIKDAENVQETPIKDTENVQEILEPLNKSSEENLSLINNEEINESSSEPLKALEQIEENLFKNVSSVKRRPGFSKRSRKKLESSEITEPSINLSEAFKSSNAEENLVINGESSKEKSSENNLATESNESLTHLSNTIERSEEDVSINEEIRGKEEYDDNNKYDISEEDLVNDLNKAFINHREIVPKTVKSRRAPRKVGQARNGKRKVKTVSNALSAIPIPEFGVTQPPLETNLDDVINVQEVPLNPPPELTTTTVLSVKSVNNQLINEDEPVLLENKMVEVPETSRLPSDSEDELPLASLIKMGEPKSISGENDSVESNLQNVKITRKRSKSKQKPNNVEDDVIPQDETEKEAPSIEENAIEISALELEKDVSSDSFSISSKSSRKSRKCKRKPQEVNTDNALDKNEIVEETSEKGIDIKKKQDDIKEDITPVFDKGEKLEVSLIIDSTTVSICEQDKRNKAKRNKKKNDVQTEIQPDFYRDQNEKPEVPLDEPTSTMVSVDENNLASISDCFSLPIEPVESMILEPQIAESNQEEPEQVKTIEQFEYQQINAAGDINKKDLEESEISKMLDSLDEPQEINIKCTEEAPNAIIVDNDANVNDSEQERFSEKNYHDDKITEILNQISQEIRYDENLSQDCSLTLECKGQINSEIKVVSRKVKKGAKSGSRVRNKSKTDKKIKKILESVEKFDLNLGQQASEEDAAVDLIDFPEKHPVRELFQTPAAPSVETSDQRNINNDSISSGYTDSEYSDTSFDKNSEASTTKKKQRKSKQNSLKSSIVSFEIRNGASRERKSRAAKEKARSLIARSEKLADSPTKNSEGDVDSNLDLKQPEKDRQNSIDDLVAILTSDNVDSVESSQQFYKNDAVNILGSVDEKACDELKQIENELIEMASKPDNGSENNILYAETERNMPSNDAVENIPIPYVDEPKSDEILNITEASLQEDVLVHENIIENSLLADISMEESTQDSTSIQDCIPFNLNDKTHPLCEQLFNTAVVLSKIDSEEKFLLEQVNCVVQDVIQPKRSRSPKKYKRAAKPRSKTKSKSPVKKRVSYSEDLEAIDKGSTRRLTRSKSLTTLPDGTLQNDVEISNNVDLLEKELESMMHLRKTNGDTELSSSNVMLNLETTLTKEVPLNNKPARALKRSSKKMLLLPNHLDDHTINNEINNDIVENNVENMEIPVLEPFSVAQEKPSEDDISFKQDNSADIPPPVLTIEKEVAEELNIRNDKIVISKPVCKVKKPRKRKRVGENNSKPPVLEEANNALSVDTMLENEKTFNETSEVTLPILFTDNASNQIDKPPATEQPIKIVINKHRARRKSKSYKKIEKTDNDLFEDFALVINKKTKRIPPTSIVDDSVCEEIVDLFSLPTENNKINKPELVDKCLDDSVEEMDMEIDDIPINSSIIERNTDGNVAEPIGVLKQELNSSLEENFQEESPDDCQLNIEDTFRRSTRLQTTLNNEDEMESTTEVLINDKKLSMEHVTPVRNLLQEEFVGVSEIIPNVPLLSSKANEKEVPTNGCQDPSDFKTATSNDMNSNIFKDTVVQSKSDIFDIVAEALAGELEDSLLNVKRSKLGRKSVKRTSSKQKRKPRNSKLRKPVCKETNISNKDNININQVTTEVITKTDKLNGSLEISHTNNKCEAYSDTMNLVKEIVEIADKINIAQDIDKGPNDDVFENTNLKDNLNLEVLASTSGSDKITSDPPPNFKQFVSESFANNKADFGRELSSVQPANSIEESIGSVLESIVKNKHGGRKANILPDIEPLSQILSSSDMDIAPVIDEIDKSLEIDDIYDFNEEFSYESPKKKKDKKLDKNHKIAIKPFEKVFENNVDDKVIEKLEIPETTAETLEESECLRKKSTRTAKAKALENIHEEALAELTENDQNKNKVCEVNNDLVVPKKKAPKKCKKKIQEQPTIESDVIVNSNANIPHLPDNVLPPIEKPEQIKENVIPVQLDLKKNEAENEVFQENCELRRSRRGSRKVTSYNENDLIDPLIDALENKRKSMKREKQAEKPISQPPKEPEKKLNSEELFDLLKASTENNVYVPKTSQQISFLNNVEESSSTRDFTEDNFENVFENMLEKSSLLIQSSLLDKQKDIDKIYEFTESSPENTELLKEPDLKFNKKSKTNKSVLEENIASTAESTCNSSIENTSSLPHTPDLKYTEAKSKTEESEKLNFCEICSKSFSRVENLIKHKRTLTHISKLSELEAKEAEEKAAKLQKENEIVLPEIIPDIEVSENSVKTSDSLREDINITDILQKSEQPACENVQNIQSPSFTNNQTLKLADIINDVLNKPVLHDLESDKVNSFSDIIMQNNSNSDSEFRRYKSLGERKSFDSEKPVLSANNTPTTTFAEKQISLLENIIEKQSANLPQYIDDISSSSHDSRVSNDQEESSNLFTNYTKPSTSEDTFLKPSQYEEISEDSTNIRHYEDAKLRKTLNRDEELFIECCSLLKSGSEVSNYSKKSSKVKVPENRLRSCENEPDCMESKDLVQPPACEDAHEFSDNSRTPTPLGDTFDDNASDSNTISSNWNMKNDGEPSHNQQSFTFEEVLHGEKPEDDEDGKKKLSKFDVISKTVKKQFNVMANMLSRKPEESTEPDDSQLVDKKIITKGARKVFEGLKVSIPTEELDLDEVFNCSPKTKSDISGGAFQEPEKPTKSSRKSKPVKKAQVGSNILFKVNKKKTGAKSESSNQQSQKDVYDFEETQDNVEVFAKPDYRTFRNQKTAEPPSVDKESEIEEELSEETMCNTIDSLGKDKTPPENITKKKCKIMGRIFKNHAKNKVDEVDEEIRAIPEIDNNELVENYVMTCSQLSDNAASAVEDGKKPKLSEKELDKLFDELLETAPKEKEAGPAKPPPKPKVEKPEPKVADKKKPKVKNRKRARPNSESSDDEYNINKTNKKRSNRKNAKEEDNCINLEQELRECIGVASRKSQRKCTSGKQNVLVEYWSSDEEAFEALLESQRIQSKEEGAPVPAEAAVEKPEKVDKMPRPKSAAEKKPVRKKPPAEKRQQGASSKPAANAGVSSNRRKRAAVNPLYHWSSSSEDESQNLIEVKPIREEIDDDEDRPVQHGWIVGDSPKKLVTMLALTKGKKTDIECVKEQKKRTSAGS